MDEAIKKKWTGALRSGKYKQGRGTLKSGNKYCCLGVLCSIINAKNWTMNTFLPDHVMAKVGVNRSDLKVIYKGRMRSLAGLNDSGIPFPEIADIIEEQL